MTIQQYCHMAIWLYVYKAMRPKDIRPQVSKAMRLHIYRAIWLCGSYTLYYMLHKIYSIVYTLCNTIYIIHCYGYWLWPWLWLWLGPYPTFSMPHILYSRLYGSMVICVHGYKDKCRLQNYKAMWLQGHVAIWLYCCRATKL